MRFEACALRDFRSFPSARFEWGPGLNLICGPNGSGKTNLLEGLNLLSGWGPFGGRTGRVVAWGSREGRALLAARATGESGHELQAKISTRLTLRADGKQASCTEVRLLVPSIVFLPTDIDLIDGPPSVRRLFLDRLSALCLPPYARRLAEFRQVSRRRTALLRQGRSPRATTLPFARMGGWILEARRRVCVRLSLALDGTDASAPPFSIALRPALTGSGEEYLLTALAEHEEQEARAMRPLVGPGRDDLEVAALGRPAAESLSRGQKRRLVLALILAAGRLVEARIGRKPVLLFDDLAAELDAEGRAAAGTALAGTGWQVFLTGVEDPFPDLDKNVCALFR